MTVGFAEAARQYRRHNVVTIPVAPDESRRPLMAWRNLNKPLGNEQIDRFASTYPDAATAIVCRPSGVTVVDLDEPNVIRDATTMERMIDAFGYTPLIVESPKGGAHLYYRSSGEPNADLRSSPLALNGDIRGDGGIITAPPTVRQFGPNKGKVYQYARGDITDLRHLPPVKPASLDFLCDKYPVEAKSSRPTNSSAYPEDRLFDHLRPMAYRGESQDAMIASGYEFTREHGLALPAGKIIRTAASVWRFAQEHPDWSGGPSRIAIARDVVDELVTLGDAWVLFTVLHREHWPFHPEFAVSPRAMAAGSVIRAWGQSEKRYRAARDALTECGYLVQTRYGGGGGRTPSRFKFGPKAASSLVGKSAHNTNLSPTSPAPAPVVKKERTL